MSSSEYIAKCNFLLKHSLLLIFLMLCQDTYHYRCQNVKKCFLASILKLLYLNFIQSLLVLVLQARRNNKQEIPETF